MVAALWVTTVVVRRAFYPKLVRDSRLGCLLELNRGRPIIERVDLTL